MKKNLLLLFVLLVSNIFSVKLSAQVTGFTVSMKKCSSLQLSWTGSGYHIIIAKEGSAPDFAPVDNNVYSAFPYLNLKGYSATTYGQKNYVVYNGSGSKSVIIDSLKPCTEYYFTIYEHDNNGSSTQYNPLSSSTNALTYCLNLSFDIVGKDSCEAHNQFEFKNTSTTTIPGVTYAWNFGDGKTGTGATVSHVYSLVNGKIYVILKASNSLDCENTKEQNIRIYAKKVGILDTSKILSWQCPSDYLELDIKPLITPLPKSFTYNWQFGDGTKSQFKKARHHYGKSGIYYVEVEIRTNVNLKPTSCADTLRYIAVVRQGPDATIDFKDSIQCLAGQSFTFESKLYYKTTNKWYFGDGKSDTASTTFYQYGTAGTFYPSHILIDSNGCTDTFYFKAETLSGANSSFNGLDTAYCLNSNSVQLSPVSPHGQFYGYAIKNNMLNPDTVGIFQLKYAIRLSNCSDSTTKTFKIKNSCFPSLGANMIIHTGQNITLDAGIADFYRWNTGDTTQTILVEGAKLTPGSNEFIVKASNKNGCSNSDTIIIGLDYFSNIKTLSKQSFQIYPNPVNSTLKLKASLAMPYEWQLYDLQGKLLLQGQEALNTIDFSGFEKGLYFITFRAGNLKQTFKISKE